MSFEQFPKICVTTSVSVAATLPFSVLGLVYNKPCLNKLNETSISISFEKRENQNGISWFSMDRITLIIISFTICEFFHELSRILRHIMYKKNDKLLKKLVEMLGNSIMKNKKCDSIIFYVNPLINFVIVFGGSLLLESAIGTIIKSRSSKKL